LSKYMKIKCIECGKWSNIKILAGSKQKKVCNRCLHPENYLPENV